MACIEINHIRIVCSLLISYVLRQVDAVAYARLVALNSAHLDFQSCTFDEGSMFSSDARDGLSKEGSGRVGVFLRTNLCHCYTLECNYNTGRMLNKVPPASGDGGKAERPVATGKVPPRYTIESFHDVGRGLAVAALDMAEANPWSRLPRSKFRTLAALKRHVLETVVSSRAKRAKSDGVDTAMEMPAKVLQALKKYGGIGDEAGPTEVGADEDGQAVVLEEDDGRIQPENDPPAWPNPKTRQARRIKPKRGQMQQQKPRRKGHEHRRAAFAKQGQG